ncbi:MAG TPA: MFS transporter [Nitrospiraceae bacterium]|nr:MFS transporter [Nitrospiraceae bacterium]
MKNTKQIFSWAMYDWANSAFSTVIMAGFFPIFFRDYWSAGRESESITLSLGLANSLSSLVIVILAPILGAIADRGGAKKRFLLLFAMLGITMTAGLFWVAKGHWILAMWLYMASTIGFIGGNIFYDAFIVNIASEVKYDIVSAIGFSLGYLGGGLLFAFCIFMTIHPGWFGLAGEAQAVRVSFLLVAVWWAIFSLPLLLFVKDPPVPKRLSTVQMVKEGLEQFVDTFHYIRRMKVVFLFLLAYWLYIDGVDTIIRMAVDYGKALGFGTNELILALLITQFVGFPSAIVFGKIGEKLGAKTGIYIGIIVYTLVTLWAYGMSDVREFYALAITIGLVQGGIQSLSRSLYARIIPADKAAEFFGFYNMLGKFAAVLGPIMMGWVAVLTGNPRTSILSLLLLFIGGGILLSKVNVKEGRRAAQAMADRQ